MFQVTPRLTFMKMFQSNRPKAEAKIFGSEKYPNLMGRARFYETPYGGVLVEAEVFGLLDMGMTDASAFYAFHIHETGDCSGDFSKSGMHYNPDNVPHPMHRGDLVPLLSNQGYAWGSFYDRRFEIEDIIGRSVIIHRDPDDFHTQPSGNSGEKIGCGVIGFVGAENRR